MKQLKIKKNYEQNLIQIQKKREQERKQTEETEALIKQLQKNDEKNLKEHNQLKAMHELFSCPICTEECDREFIFQLTSCSHKFCRSCMRAAVCADLEQQKLPIRCASCVGENKKTLLTQAEILSVLVPNEQKHYHKVEFELTATREGIAKCPKPNCTGYIVVEEGLLAICPISTCQYKWCKKCNVPWDEDHKDRTCEQYAKYKGERETDGFFNKAVDKLGFRKCPKCPATVERVQGCNHITCRCGTHFCYLCGKDIGARNPYAHFTQGHPTWS